MYGPAGQLHVDRALLLQFTSAQRPSPPGHKREPYVRTHPSPQAPEALTDPLSPLGLSATTPAWRRRLPGVSGAGARRPGARVLGN